MQAGAQSGACLASLVMMALPILRAAQVSLVPRGPGRPHEFEDWQIASLIYVAVLHKCKSKSSQYHFLRQRQPLLKRLLDLRNLPARSTYFARYRHAHKLLQQAVRLQGRKAIREGIADPRIVAVDKSLVAAKGRPWRRRRGKPVTPVPAGVDKDAGWTWTKHRDWVWGYGFETVVTATAKGLVFPLLASVAPANYSEHKSFKDKIPQLPGATRHVLADSAYDSNTFQSAIEYDREGRRTGKHFICPLVRRGGKPKAGLYPHRGERGLLLARRHRRLKYLESPRGQKLYKRRSKTIEPFHEWFKSSFELSERAWHRGLANNQTQILAAIFSYQTLVRYNYRKGNKNARIQQILHSL